MTTLPVTVPHHATTLPTVNKIGLSDVRIALARGLDDFRAMPTHVIFVIVIYPVVGLLIGAAVFHNGLIPLLFPLASGFALVGPFAAVGLYELSRRRAEGLDTGWTHAYDAFRTPSAGALAGVGLLLAAIFLAWLVTAMALYAALFGGQTHESVSTFLGEILTTPRGWTMIVVGNLAGIAFSMLALAVSVVSFPMLGERDVDAQVAVRTSIAVVQENPVTMAVWGLVVGSLLVLGMLPLLIGLAVVMPVLGHATWHLYRRAVPA